MNITEIAFDLVYRNILNKLEKYPECIKLIETNNNIHIENNIKKIIGNNKRLALDFVHNKTVEECLEILDDETLSKYTHKVKTFLIVMLEEEIPQATSFWLQHIDEFLKHILETELEFTQSKCNNIEEVENVFRQRLISFIKNNDYLNRNKTCRNIYADRRNYK